MKKKVCRTVGLAVLLIAPAKDTSAHFPFAGLHDRIAAKNEP